MSLQVESTATRLKFFLCISEPVSAKENAEELRLPVPISATSTFNSTWGIYFMLRVGLSSLNYKIFTTFPKISIFTRITVPYGEFGNRY